MQVYRFGVVAITRRSNGAHPKMSKQTLYSVLLSVVYKIASVWYILYTKLSVISIYYIEITLNEDVTELAT